MWCTETLGLRKILWCSLWVSLLKRCLIRNVFRSMNHFARIYYTCVYAYVTWEWVFQTLVGVWKAVFGQVDLIVRAWQCSFASYPILRHSVTKCCDVCLVDMIPYVQLHCVHVVHHCRWKRNEKMGVQMLHTMLPFPTCNAVNTLPLHYQVCLMCAGVFYLFSPPGLRQKQHFMSLGPSMFDRDGLS